MSFGILGEMDGTATRRTEQTQESRRLLLTAAADLFAEKGYRQTSYIDIAGKAGISRGSIPWHFGNKLGLLEAVVDDQVQQVLGQVDDSDVDSLRQITNFIRRPRSRLFIALLLEAVDVDSPVRTHHARLHAALREAVEKRLPAALPPETAPGPLAALLVGAVIGVHVQWRVAPENVDLDAVGDTLHALLPKMP